jgi:hypothetical protein
MTSRDVASGSTREKTVLKKNSSSPALVSTAYVPCSSVTKSATKPSASGLSMMHRFAKPRTSSG